MTTASPIPASLATACAAHDRHRLDVIDALLDEAAPSAVRELLGAALDLCASLRADRDTLAAKLDATPKVCAIHSYALEGPCMTCGAPWPGAEKALRQERVEGMEKMLRISRAVGCPNSVEEVVEAVAAIKADLASERARLAACQTRIAGLEQAANERSAEVARLTARVAELEARPVLTVEMLDDAMSAVGYGAAVLPGIPAQLMRHLGPVTLLPAQDLAEELTQAIHGTPREEVNPAMWRGMVERTRSALTSLGAPPTSPTVAPIDADALYARCEADFMGGYSGQLYDAFKHGMWTVCNVLRSTKPTSPPAARPVFAEVSEDELIRLFYVVGTDGIDHGEQCPPIDSSDRNGIRAVLARLEVSLVAEADPEAVARDYANNAATGYAPGIDHPPYWFEYTDEQRTKRTAAMRATLTARGIPVAPEVRK